MIYSRQALLRIGSVGRGGYGGGGSRRDSINIYIKGVEIKKGIFLLQLVAKVSACTAEDSMRLVAW